MNRQAAVVAGAVVIAVALVAILVATRTPNRNTSRLPGVNANDTSAASSNSAADTNNPCTPSTAATSGNSGVGSSVGTAGNGIGSAQNGSSLQDADGRRSTTTTATTPQGTTPDGAAPAANNAEGRPTNPPTGVVAGAPCTPGSNETNTGLGTAGSGTTSMRQGGTSGSGQTHGSQSDR